MAYLSKMPFPLTPFRKLWKLKQATFEIVFFPPDKTLLTFLRQVMSSDHSCLDAVAKFNEDRMANGLAPASPETGSYCKARGRLSEGLIRGLLTPSANALDVQIPNDWLWKGRQVKIMDGTTLSMPDTVANQAVYPQQKSQAPGVGFPLVRCVAVMSLATACVLDIAIGPWTGKETGEHALLRQLFHCFAAGDIALGDAYYDSYFLIAMLSEIKVDGVFHMHGSRKADFRQGRKLGKGDHLVAWQRPAKPEWMGDEVYELMPAEMTMREVRVEINVPGFRTKHITMTTTLRDPRVASSMDLADLYRQRWSCEVNFAAIKTTMQMDRLRCKTPEMVRKEILAHLLAYNLLRIIIAKAAVRNQLKPNQISFKGAMQTFNAYRSLWASPDRCKAVPDAYNFMLDAIASHRVGNRPGRSEPRVVKRRPKPYPKMKKPRRQYRNHWQSNVSC